MAPNKQGRRTYRWNASDGYWELWDGQAWVVSALLKHLDGTQEELVKPYGIIVDYNPNERQRQWP